MFVSRGLQARCVVSFNYLSEKVSWVIRKLVFGLKFFSLIEPSFSFPCDVAMNQGSKGTHLLCIWDRLRSAF